jgi:hypothetical protein
VSLKINRTFRDRSLIFALGIFISTAVNAHQAEEGKVLATAGPYLQQTHSRLTQDVTNSPVSVGLGLIAEGDTSQSGGIEIGVFYFEKAYLRGFGTSHLVEKVNKLAVDVGYRLWWTNRISSGFLFTSLFSVGDYRVIAGDTMPREGTAARDPNEYGFTYSMQWEFWSGERFAALLDGRYFYAVQPKSEQDSNQYGMLIGFKYLIQ